MLRPVPPPPPPQFFVLLLLVFLLEATITILFFAYTDKVQPPPPPSFGQGPHPRAGRSRASVPEKRPAVGAPSPDPWGLGPPGGVWPAQVGSGCLLLDWERLPPLLFTSVRAPL